MLKIVKKGRVFALPSLEEDKDIIAAALADPDAQPMTDEQLAQMVPIQQLPELLKKLRK
ncbi:hypothetical protein [Pseudoduganella namucuonensis]|uniref:Uncharacterized protein n=1 Tax=Pseudoduganella namucuonensis TaxID=1035707 RepID=A0A1I7LB29_9BURK|nr:hypothetical protein [Pseudoduganella namucuonensis]SFV06736.1 hypothetical protein SAMN05216552_1025104 [Pseudoduganella namucuonensis]